MKALFVGLGSIGQRHLRNLRRLRPDIAVAAVRRSRCVPVLSDTNQVIPGATVSGHYGLTEYDSLDQALGEGFDLVFVTNPTSLHLQTAALALASGARVFIEKPLSHDWEGVRELARAERLQGRGGIAMGYQYRFHPALRLVARMLESGRLGALVSARLVNGEYMPGWHPYEDYRQSYAARRDLGGGALVTQIHDFDYALWLFGLPSHVYAVGGRLSTLEIDVEDSVQALLRCGSPSRALPVSIALDYLQWPPSRGVEIVGENGRITCDLLAPAVTLTERPAGKVERHEFPGLVRNDLFVDELRNFLAFAAGEAEPAVDLSGGMASLRVALAARRSMETMRGVPLDWD